MPAGLKYTWHIILMALAGWINRQQQDIIEYLMEENRVLPRSSSDIRWAR